MTASTATTASSASAPAPKPSVPKRKSDGPVKKRGPPRPHKKLTADVLKTRITKLQKRIDRAQSQLQDAERHIAGYLRESGLRDAEAEAGEN